MMDENKQYTLIFLRMNRGWAVITSLRQVSLAGMPYAKKIVAEQHKALMADLTASGTLEQLMIGVNGPDDLRKTGDWLHQQLTDLTVRNASHSIDAASLVFAHTVLDDALGSFLEITSDLATSFWQDRVGKKQIDIEVLKQSSIAQVWSAAVEKEVGRIVRNDSILTKCDLLHAICKPLSAPQNEARKYKFDRAVLARLDQLRQEIIHGDLLGDEIPDMAENLGYLQDTWFYFFILMHDRFNLRIDPQEMSSRT